MASTPKGDGAPAAAAAVGRAARAARRVSRASVERAYRRYAPVYDGVFGGVFGGVLAPGRRALAAAVARIAPASVLEIGVGTGLTLSGYPSATHVVGIDLSGAMLARARGRAARLAGRRIDLLRMNAEALAFGDGSFDCVVAPYVLSVTPDPRRLVAEMRRVCRAGGAILVLNHFNGGGGWGPFERLLRPFAAAIGFRSDFAFAAAMAGHDWTVESVETVNLFGLSRLVTVRNDRAA